jgi:hypothetical protein
MTFRGMNIGTALAMTVVAITSGCAGTIGGQLDGKDVPGFGSLAFGEADVSGGGLFVFGVGVPGDSCAFGGELLPTAVDGLKARKANDAKGLEGSLEDTADVINAAVQVDDWVVQMFLVAEDDSDLRDDVLDIGDDTPEVAVFFSLCRQKAEAEVKDGELDQNADCYFPKDGEIAVNHTDDNRLSLKATDEVKFVDEDGDTAGRVTLDFTFSRCPVIDDAAEDFVDVQEAPAGG